MKCAQQKWDENHKKTETFHQPTLGVATKLFTANSLRQSPSFCKALHTLSFSCMFSRYEGVKTVRIVFIKLVAPVTTCIMR